MKTSAPSVDALYRLTLFRVQSPWFFGKAANTPVGTGPFKFAEYVPNDHLTLERFDGYWKPIPSNIKTLTFRFYTDPEAMLNAALAGELDILQFGQLKDAATLEGAGWAAYAAPIADYVMLVLNYTAPEFGVGEREHPPGRRARHRSAGDREERVFRSRAADHHSDAAFGSDL